MPCVVPLAGAARSAATAAALAAAALAVGRDLCITAAVTRAATGRRRHQVECSSAARGRSPRTRGRPSGELLLRASTAAQTGAASRIRLRYPAASTDSSALLMAVTACAGVRECRVAERSGCHLTDNHDRTPRTQEPRVGRRPLRELRCGLVEDLAVQVHV